MLTLSAREARLCALAAQGLHAAPKAAPSARQLQRVLAQIHLLQLDSVNVLARAHYLPLYARLGPYPQALLEEAAWGRKKTLFEYWAHEASLLPHGLQPLLRWRMEDAARGIGVWPQAAAMRGERPYLRQILGHIRTHGATSAGELEQGGAKGGWWGWSRAKCALEYLFWTGELCAVREQRFERRYDLPERVLPAEILAQPTPARADAQRQLLAYAAHALGVAAEADLRDYFRLPAEGISVLLGELVEAGTLERVAVEGWNKPGFRAVGAKMPRKASHASLLSPFDPLVWNRARALRLFGFDYRLEIYTPAHKRVHGYYVLPFLLDGQLAARVDLKALRAEQSLAVLAAYAEPDAPAHTAEALRAELRRLADWLGLERVIGPRKGDLAAGLGQLR